MQPTVFSELDNLYNQQRSTFDSTLQNIAMGNPGAMSDALTQALEATVAGLEKGASAAVESFNALSGRTKSLLAGGAAITIGAAATNPLGGLLVLGGAALGYYIRGNLDEIRAVVERIKNLVATIVSKYTPVVSLIKGSFAWVGDVMTPASAVANRAGRPAAYAMEDWQGTAGTAYRMIRAEQKEATSQSVAHSSTVSDLLFRVASTNIDYCLAALKGVVAVGLKIWEAAGNAATIVAALEAINKATEVVSEIATQLFDLLLNYARGLVAAIGDMLKLKTAMGNYEKLPGGKWPQAVTTPTGPQPPRRR